MDISQYSEEEIFILALEKNSFKIIELLIKNKDASKNSNFLAGKENIIFLQAVEKGCTSLVKFLLKHGADVNTGMIWSILLYIWRCEKIIKL